MIWRLFDLLLDLLLGFGRILLALAPKPKPELVDIENSYRPRLEAVVREMMEIMEPAGFVVGACGRCGETEYRVLRSSPNGLSLQLACPTCDRRIWAKARTPHPRCAEMADLFAQINLLLHRAHQEAREIVPTTTFHGWVTLTSTGLSPPAFVRERISADLRTAVFTRDGGRCVVCGVQEDLQFDHIIPVSRGGATNESNLQILCGPCNRSKGARI